MENNIKRYQEYQLQWMLDNGYSLADLMDVLKVSVNEALELEPSLSIDKAIQEGFDCLDSVNGFSGELWAGYNEWLANEHLEEVEEDLEVRPFQLSDVANHLDDVKKLDEMSGSNFARSAEGSWNEWNNFLWGCFYQGEVIGYCAIGQAISYFDEEDSPEIWDYPDLGYGTSLAIFELFVKPEYSGVYVGSEFVKRAIEMRRKDEAQIGNDLVRYFVEVENEPQRNFFEKLGFKEIPSKNSKRLGMVLEPKLEIK